jgi:predicted nucleic acid-binding protein
MEMLGVKSLSQEVFRIRKALIENCYLVTFNSDIKEIAIQIKQQTTLKLPDAIAAGSALYMGLPLVTADKGFSKIAGLHLHLLKL